MPQVAIALSGLPFGLNLLRPLTPAISAAFAPYGIDLAFYPQNNVVFSSDPEGPPSTWPALVQALERQSNYSAPVHLTISNDAPEFDQSIDGMLCDTQYRGVAAVYMNANIYGSGGPQTSLTTLLQVCIHEIGHLFNLTHGDAALSNYGSAMSPATIRQYYQVPTAWSDAAAEAANIGEQLFIPTQAPFYPFNAACRRSLASVATDPTRLPFHGSFAGGTASAANDVYRRLTCSIAPYHADPAISVGGIPFLDVTLRNELDSPIDLPLHLGLEHGTVRVIVHDPDGNARYFRASQLVCSSARQELAPGAERHLSLAIPPDLNGAHFTQPGNYRCVVEIVDAERVPRALIAEADITIAARHDEKARLAYDALARAEKRRTPRYTDLQTLASDAGLPGLVGEIRLRRALVGSVRKHRLERLTACLTPDNPRMVRHRAGRRLAVERVAAGERPSRIVDDLRRAFDAAEDRQLHLAIVRSLEGWAVSRLRQELQ